MVEIPIFEKQLNEELEYNYDDNNSKHNDDSDDKDDNVDKYDTNEWKYQRLIWIAFYKNDDNDDCFLKKFTKDTILFIASLFKSPKNHCGNV